MIAVLIMLDTKQRNELCGECWLASGMAWPCKCEAEAMGKFKEMAGQSATVEQYHFEPGQFSGADYDDARDRERLTGQMLRIWDLMIDGQWRSVSAIASVLSIPETSASAQLRSLRKKDFGGHDVQRRHNGAGYYEFKLVPAKPAGQVEMFD